MTTEEKKYEQLRNRRIKPQASDYSGNLSGGEDFNLAKRAKTSEDYHRQLSAVRARDSKMRMKQAASASSKPEKRPKKIAPKALSAASQAKAAKKMALAFTAINPMEDAVHWVVIFISIMADVFTIIPIIGSFFALLFGGLIWFIYALSGHFKKAPGVKAATTAISQFFEVFGLGFLPLFTMSAIINYWFALAEKKLKKEEEGR
ncbi:MAG: hypothetical protein U9M90_01120 [Patescibacteria group bacterium]|nr:hypothetical protein [Patescibacteria group bacterium]